MTRDESVNTQTLVFTLNFKTFGLMHFSLTSMISILISEFNYTSLIFLKSQNYKIVEILANTLSIKLSNKYFQGFDNILNVVQNP